MHQFQLILKFTLVAVLIISTSTVLGQSWQSRLQDGSRIQVDPNTNKPVIINNKGISTPLWDGVHQLENGSSVTVRDGVMVPNQQILNYRHSLPQARSSFVMGGPSPCIVLQRKVCGLYGECSDRSSCTRAKQLVQFEKDEEQERRIGATFSYRQTHDQCHSALQDNNMFGACPKRKKGRRPTPCEELVLKVCGSNDQCDGQPACPAAQQLVEMEYQERISSLSPNTATYTTGQCRQALWDKEFFKMCGK